MKEIDKTIRNASAHELELWLKKSKGGDTRHWQYAPHPLYRAAELGRGDLFKKWLGWGCHLWGLHGGGCSAETDSYDSVSIVANLLRINPKVVNLIGDHCPEHLEPFLREIMRYDPKKFGNFDVFRVLTQMRTEKVDTTEMVSDMIVMAIGVGHGPLKQLLEFNNGVIAPSCDWKNKYNPFHSDFLWGGIKDTEAYQRINNLPSELISSVDATVFLELGLLLAVYSLKMHLEITDRSDQFVVNRKKTDWRTIRGTFNEWNTWSFKEDEWMNVFNSLLDDVLSLRSTGGYHRSTVFSFIRAAPLPESVLTMLAHKAWEARPDLMHLKTEHPNSWGHNQKAQSFIEVTETSNGALQNIRASLLALDIHERLQRVVKTQVRKRKTPEIVRKRKM